MYFENDKIYIKTPELKDKDAVIDFRQEFIDNHEEMYGHSSFIDSIDYENWLKKLELNLHAENLPKDRVPAIQFLTYSKLNNRLVGMVNVRLGLTDGLRLHGGHIGDCVRASERNKGYGTLQIGLALKCMQDMGFDRALITCKRQNVASRRTIMKNGGVLENEVEFEGDTYQRFWIALN